MEYTLSISIFSALCLLMILIIGIPLGIVAIAFANKNRFINLMLPVANKVTREQAHRLLAQHRHPTTTVPVHQLPPREHDEMDASESRLTPAKMEALTAGDKPPTLSTDQQVELRGLIQRTINPDPWEEFYRIQIRNPQSTSTELAKHIINRAAFNNAFLGFVTGIPGPFVTPVLAPVDTLATGRIKAVMVQSIAYAYDVYDEDIDIIKKRALMIMFGGSQMTEFGKVMALHFLTSTLQKSVLRSFPVIGGVIGGTVNWIVTQAVGRAAIRYYHQTQPQPREHPAPTKELVSPLNQTLVPQLTTDSALGIIAHEHEIVEQRPYRLSDRRLVQAVQQALECHSLEDVLFNLNGHIDLVVKAELMNADAATQARKLVTLCRSHRQRTALVMSLRDFEDDLLGTSDEQEGWLTWARELDNHSM